MGGGRQGFRAAAAKGMDGGSGHGAGNETGLIDSGGLGAFAVDKAIKDIPFPRESVIASVQRGRQVFIPRGETVLRAGDVLVVVVTEGAARDEVARLCRQPDGELPE